MSLVYGIQSGLFIKVGTTNNILARLRQMNLYNPHPCKVVARIETTYARRVEMRVHKILAAHAVGREWFMVDVARVREAMKLAKKHVRDEQVAWENKCNQRQAARGRDVELSTSEEITQ